MRFLRLLPVLFTEFHAVLSLGGIDFAADGADANGTDTFAAMGGACASNATCAEACAAAQDDGDVAACNTGISCSLWYGRCECAGDAALRLDGVCVESPNDINICTPNFDASFNFATGIAPELTSADTISGNASARFVVVLRMGVAAALEVPAVNVSVSHATVTRTSGSVSALPPGGLVQVDLAFRFCSVEPLGELDAGTFEVGFVAAAQRYAAFHLSTLRLVSLTHLETIRNDTSVGHTPIFINEASGDGGSSGPRSEVLIAIFASCCGAVALSALAVFWCWLRRRRRRQKVSNSDDILPIDTGECDDEAGPGVDAVLAHVACAFSPEDVEDDKVFRDSCLNIREGDIIEVIAGGGGWLYGRLLSPAEGTDSNIERTGYFPENRVSWVGKISAEGLVTSAEQHLLVAVESGFAPEDVAEDEGEGHENLLVLGSGEIVEVLAGAGGWLYGRVVGQPERVGYFPQTYATRVGVSADEPQQGGMLVKVEAAFEPGVPAEKSTEEEASFAGCCIAVEEGDVVEVVAGGGGWLYGRVVGAPERAGYFPEARVSWLGRPVAVGTEDCAASLRNAADVGADGAALPPGVCDGAPPGDGADSNWDAAAAEEP